MGVDLLDIQAKGITYKALRQVKVCNIPYCLVAGNISTPKYHFTCTSTYITADCTCHSDAHFIPHQHCWLTLDVIECSLTMFKTSYKMVTAVQDTLICKFLQCSYQGRSLISTAFSTWWHLYGWNITPWHQPQQYHHYYWQPRDTICWSPWCWSHNPRHVTWMVCDNIWCNLWTNILIWTFSGHLAIHVW